MQTAANSTPRATFHQGLDYAVVMLDGETTETASISLHGEPGENARLAETITRALNGTPEATTIVSEFEAIFGKLTATERRWLTLTLAGQNPDRRPRSTSFQR